MPIPAGVLGLVRNRATIRYSGKFGEAVKEYGVDIR
jgi:hypothetical protein